MKSFLYSLCSECILLLIVEVFCPTKHTKKIVCSVFSLVAVLLVVNGFVSLKNELGETLSFSNLDVDYENLYKSQIDNLETQIRLVLESEGIETKEIDIEYMVDSFSVEYTNVYITITGGNETIAKDVISKILNIDKERIFVIEN